MQIASGAAAKVVLGFETTFGTLATDGFVVPVVKCTLRRSRNKVDNPEIAGDFNPGKPLNGDINVSGQIIVLLDAITAWYWFKSMFNTSTTTGTGPYVHEFKMTGLTARPSISVEVQYLDLAAPKYFQYVGCKISSYSVSPAGGGHSLLTMDVVGKDRTIASSPFDVAPTDLSRAPLDNSHAAIKVGGTAFATSTSTSLKVNFNPDTSKRFVGGGGTVGVISDSIIKSEGTHDFVFEDTVLLEQAVASTETSMELDFTAAADQKVNFLCSEITFAEHDPGIEGPQGIAVSLPWYAYYDNAAGASSIVATVTNAEAHA